MPGIDTEDNPVQLSEQEEQEEQDEPADGSYSGHPQHQARRPAFALRPSPWAMQVLKGLAVGALIVGLGVLIFIAMTGSQVNRTFMQISSGLSGDVGGGGTGAAGAEPPSQGAASGNSANWYSETGDSATGATGGIGWSGAGNTAGQGQTGGTAERVIIRTADLSLLVEDVPSAVSVVKQAVAQQGGYVSTLDMQAATQSPSAGGTAGSSPDAAGQTSSPAPTYSRATLTLKVPAEKFDALMEKLRVSGIKVLGESVKSQDATEEYVDAQSQLRNLRATEGRITALMGRAEKIEDVLALDKELRQIQGEIERIQGRINFLQQSAALSTIQVVLQIEPPPPVQASPQPEEGWDAFGIAGRAWNASLATLQTVAGAVITVAVYLWWLALLAALLYGARWLLLRRARQRGGAGA